MRIVYVGPHTEVVVDATGHVAKRNGAPIDVPDELGKSLIQQDTWQREETDAERKARAKAEKDAAEQQKAADAAAAEAVKKVKAEQAKRDKGTS